MTGTSSAISYSSLKGLVDTKIGDVNTKIEALGSGEISTSDMFTVQFEIGQYSALMESFSSVTKSITDSMKSIAQRSS